MRELVPLTNAVAARMIISALSAGGGFDAFLADARVSATTAADAATGSAAQTAPTAKSAAKAVLPALPEDGKPLTEREQFWRRLKQRFEKNVIR